MNQHPKTLLSVIDHYAFLMAGRKHLQDIPIRVINLEKRADRLSRLRAKLELTGLQFSPLNAVDGSDPNFGDPSSGFLSPGLAANWLSHQAAYSELASSDREFMLILEDDADFSPNQFNRRRLESHVLLMDKHGVDLLQIGFISHLYRIWSPRGFLDYVIAIRARRIKMDKDLREVFVQDEFRAGAHGYIIRRSLAEKLIGKNVPAALASDYFLSSLAASGSSFRIARLFRSILEQESRQVFGGLVDSDV
jgi:GR25 family glycosyltransferase involved in LPS biosynthesis